MSRDTSNSDSCKLFLGNLPHDVSLLSQAQIRLLSWCALLLWMLQFSLSLQSGSFCGWKYYFFVLLHTTGGLAIDYLWCVYMWGCVCLKYPIPYVHLLFAWLFDFRTWYVMLSCAQVTEDDIKDSFKQYGEIKEVKLIEKAGNFFAFLEFEDKLDA